MPAKGPGLAGRFLSYVFTAVVAPISVSLVIQHANLGEAKSLREEPGHSTLHSARSTRENGSALEDRTEVIAQGVGWTPEEALRVALGNALRTTLITLVDANVYARHGQELFDAIQRDTSGLVVSHQDLTLTTNWQQGRTFYNRTVNVTIARPLLAARVKTALALVR